MLKIILLCTLVSFLISSQKKCNDGSKTDTCLKGRLEIKAICSNYTIKLLEGTVDTSKIVKRWTDENTGKTFSNVFALDNPCSFPADIKQGEEFYFTIQEVPDKDCNVCMAYYPVPPKKIAIKIIPTCK